MAFSLFYCTIDCTIDQSFWKQKAKVEIIISAINNRYISVVTLEKSSQCEKKCKECYCRKKVCITEKWKNIIYNIFNIT